jgi:ATP-dependent Lon protease
VSTSHRNTKHAPMWQVHWPPIQGNIKAGQSLAEPLRMAMENGARRALIPLDNKRNFLEVSGEIMEKVDPIFFSDPQTAAAKALALV